MANAESTNKQYWNLTAWSSDGFTVRKCWCEHGKWKWNICILELES